MCASLLGSCGLRAAADAAAVEPEQAIVSAAFDRRVEPKLQVPPEEASRYGMLAIEQLVRNGSRWRAGGYVVVVDRDPHVQAAFLYALPERLQPTLIGASPVSTGLVGRVDHFETPLGVFDHSLANPDYRAEGTKNSLGIRGYGIRGMRVFDFGWQQATRGWGSGGVSTMRLQLHATDPDILEPRLGTVQSKGCIRISASLNRLLDGFGLLDADYQLASASSEAPWVLLPDRTPVSHPGRFLVVVDTGRVTRPAWSPLPAGRSTSRVQALVGTTTERSPTPAPPRWATCNVGAAVVTSNGR